MTCLQPGGVHEVVDQPYQLGDLPLHDSGGLARGCAQRLEPQDLGDVAQRRQRIAQFVRERGEELVFQLRLVMQPLLAVFQCRAGFFGFVLDGLRP